MKWFVLQNRGGHLLLDPAWLCPRWLSQGYQVRPYSDFGLLGRIYKSIIPLLKTRIIRYPLILLYRLRIVFALLLRTPIKLYYKKLNANYDVYWEADSDACNSLDMYAMIAWFESRGHKCVSHSSFRKKFFSSSSVIDIEIIK